MPKNHTPTAVVGRSASRTSSIMRETLELACVCGELERM